MSYDEFKEIEEEIIQLLQSDPIPAITVEESDLNIDTVLQNLVRHGYLIVKPGDKDDIFVSTPKFDRLVAFAITFKDYIEKRIPNLEKMPSEPYGVIYWNVYFLMRMYNEGWRVEEKVFKDPNFIETYKKHLEEQKSIF